MARFNVEELDAAMVDLSMLEFWPADPATRAAIQAYIARIVPSKEALDWVVSALLNRVNRWPGPAQFRALLATRYKPADGEEGIDCTLPGFTPGDSEARHYDRHQQIMGGGYPEGVGGRKEIASADHEMNALVGKLAIVRRIQ